MHVTVSVIGIRAFDKYVFQPIKRVNEALFAKYSVKVMTHSNKHKKSIALSSLYCVRF